ncbi:MAG: tetratricopeptide repeat protein, partial [Gallionellaceae bacterium]
IMSKTGRNDPCPCGSGKKYKQCCLLRKEIPAANKPAINTVIPQAIQEAIEHHQAGRLPEAEAIYRQILQVEPGHPDALHLLGMLAHQVGRKEIAVELIGKAIKVNPSEPMYHNNLGMALETQGKLDAAAECFCKALLLKPGYAKAHFNLGNILRAQGKLDAAVASYNNAILCQPDYAEAHNNLGNAFKDQGKLDEAVEHYHTALALKPDYAEAHNNLGNARKDQGRLDEAVEHYKMAIVFQPGYAEAHNNLGNAFKDLKQLDAALASYSKAIAIKPDHADAYFNQGNVLKELNQLDSVLASYDKAIAIKPDYAEAYINRGTVLQELKQFDAALANYDEAIAIKPDHADAYNNRGNVLKDQGRLDKAAQHYHKALSLKPDYAEAHHNLGIVLTEQGKLEAAVESYHEALSLKPGYAEGLWNKALLCLLLGDFDKGWEGYEWRWKNDNLKLSPRNFTQPLWAGKESLAGKTILLHSEQGLGDAIQFCRYARMVADLGADVILEVKPPLFNLLANLDGVSQLVANGSSLPAFDFHCPLLSLPLAFKTNMGSIPASTPYLTADAGKVARWHVKLGAKSNPRVGLVWSGNAQHKNDRNRSVLLSELLKHLPDDYQYVSLQKERREEDREILQSRPDILHFGDELNDFSDTAALCELVDVIISVDTSVAHLAGALGKQVWILLPFMPDWRWLLDRSDSPWYPTAKLFRQEKNGDWEGVFEKVRSDLVRSVFCR